MAYGPLILDNTNTAPPFSETPASAQGMAVQPPACENDGSYAREQRAGGLSWCVDGKGRPVHETLTRGHVRCGTNGEHNCSVTWLSTSVWFIPYSVTAIVKVALISELG